MSEDSQHQSSDPFPEGPLDDPLAFEEPKQASVNRPASGARQVMPGEILSMDFRGSDTAGDFLGLDTEFTESTIDPGAGETLDLAQAPLSGQAAEPTAPLHEVMDPEVYDDDGSYDAEYEGEDLGGDYESGEYDEYDEFGGESEDYTAEGELFDEGFEGEDLAVASGSRTKLLVGSVVVIGMLTAAAVTLAPRFLSDTPDDGTNVARGTIDKTPVQPVEDPGTTTEDPNTIDLDPLNLDPTLDPTDVVDSGAVEVPNIEDFITPDPTGTESDPFDLTGILTDPGTNVGPGTDPAPDATTQISNIFGLDGGQEEFPDFAQNFEWVSEDMLDMIWRGTEVPLEAIGAPARTLMPRVGMVMVHMTSGEVFEGRLYAVGEGRVWIDTQPGRVGLEGDLVERIARTQVDDGVVAGNSQPAAKGRRVRVQLPGGPIYGRVLVENGNLVTLVTDEGAKVTVADATLEPLGNRRAIIIHR